MIRTAQTLGLIFHYFNRAVSIFISWYWGWTIRSYITARSKRCGSVNLGGYGRFTNISALEIGDNVHINSGAFWVCEGGLYIGDNTIFARNVTIYTRNHNYSGAELPFDHENVYRPVHIGKNVWVGTNVTILPGARIGDGAIIGAGAVVAGDVEQGTIFAAQKAHRLGARNMTHYEELDRARAFHRPKYFPWTK